MLMFNCGFPLLTTMKQIITKFSVGSACDGNKRGIAFTLFYLVFSPVSEWLLLLANSLIFSWSIYQFLIYMPMPDLVIFWINYTIKHKFWLSSTQSKSDYFDLHWSHTYFFWSQASHSNCHAIKLFLSMCPKQGIR